jgi:serine/threonine protein kinase
MLSEGTVLQGRYRIVRQLGQGGMGAVYEAVDERLDTIVALKETLFADEKLRKQFEREARLLARLHHPALPRVSDHFNEGDGQFLVMQYIAGDDLSEMLSARTSPFPQEDVVRWADQLCDALDYLHTQDPQIIHRDIKPQNLKLTGRGQIVLLDFGLAKGSAGQLTAVTTSASIFGYTPNYAPLEQVQGMGTDTRSDIYALGATLYHLLTNVKPPDALSRASAVVNGLPDPLPPANQVNPAVSAAVANVLGKSMSQKRDDRFATASLMREAMTIAADHSTADAETLVTRAPATFAGSSTVLSESATKIAGGQTQRGAPSFASEAQTLVAGETTNVRTVTASAMPPARSNWQPWIAAAIAVLVIGGGAAGFFAYRNRQNQQQAVPPATENQTGSQPVAQPSQTVNSVTASSPEAPKTSEAKPEKSKSEVTTQKLTTKKPDRDGTQVDVGPPPVVDPGHDPNRDRDPNRDPNRRRDPNAQWPRQGDFDPFRPPDGRQPGHPRPTPEIRTLPNGGRMIKQPDGTVIFVGPKGGTRVISPNPKPPKRPTPEP